MLTTASEILAGDSLSVAGAAPGGIAGEEPGPVTAALREMLDAHRAETPFLAVDLDVVADRYRSLRSAFPGVDVYYAVKALPGLPVLRVLRELGCRFDTAGLAEVEGCLAAGAAPSAVSFTNPVKPAAAIAESYRHGVRRFTFDSEGELRKIAECAPGSSVQCRILTGNAGAAWPLSRKFGCEPDLAADLLVAARGLGLTPAGVSFHVGSQQRDPAQWDPALADAAGIFRACAARGVDLELVNLGGGLPIRYTDEVPDVGTYGEVVLRAVRRHFGASAPRLCLEPGRHLVGDAGVLRTTVLLVSRKSARDGEPRWVYLDAGRFGGLAETEGEAIRYRIEVSRTASPAEDGDRPGTTAVPEDGEVILAGPTCDGVDILYERNRYRLPLDLRIGDALDFHGAGAYTVCYAAAGFNGFSPPRVFFARHGLEIPGEEQGRVRVRP